MFAVPQVHLLIPADGWPSLRKQHEGKSQKLYPQELWGLWCHSYFWPIPDLPDQLGVALMYEKYFKFSMNSGREGV